MEGQIISQSIIPNNQSFFSTTKKEHKEETQEEKIKRLELEISYLRGKINILKEMNERERIKIICGKVPPINPPIHFPFNPDVLPRINKYWTYC